MILVPTESGWDGVTGTHWLMSSCSLSCMFSQCSRRQRTPISILRHWHPLQLVCGELFSARVPKSSAEVRRVFIHDIKEGEGVGQQEEKGDKRDDEKGDEVKGEVEEVTQRAHET